MSRSLILGEYVAGVKTDEVETATTTDYGQRWRQRWRQEFSNFQERVRTAKNDAVKYDKAWLEMELTTVGLATRCCLLLLSDVFWRRGLDPKLWSSRDLDR